MVETNLTIIVNQKSDIEFIKQIVTQNRVHYPVYIFEYEFHYQIRFTSDNEEWNLNTVIEENMPDYNFVTELYGGSSEIRMQISRYQNPYSLDGWGGPIESSVNQTCYLIKRGGEEVEKYSPAVEVLFLGESKQYFIHIINGINKATDEKGFLISKDFKNSERIKNSEFYADTLYRDEVEAFQHGYYKLQEEVQDDFAKFIDDQNKAIREQRKIPRKLVRGFINSCNKADVDTILKGLDQNFVFERQIDWNCQLKIEGPSEMERYLRSGEHDLFSNNFKIRSSWDFKNDKVFIGVKYYPKNERDSDSPQSLTYRYYTFTLEENKIIKILEGNRLMS